MNQFSKIERDLGVTKPVFSFLTPRVRKIVLSLKREDTNQILLGSVEPFGFPISTFERFGLDDWHEDVINHLIRYYEFLAPGLERFTYRYPTMGSEEGIREVFTSLALQGVKGVNVFEGDYEGYQAVAKSRGIQVFPKNLDYTHLSGIKPAIWFISNPSAKDGNLLPDQLINDLLAAGHQIYLDLAYVGTTPDFYTFSVTHPNILGVFVSFSKPYGLFYDRIGFTFTRQEVTGLFGNKWFKHIHSLRIADAVMDGLSAAGHYDYSYAQEYKRWQTVAVNALNDQLAKLYQTPESEPVFQSSDVFLLAHVKRERVPSLPITLQYDLKPFLRENDGYRVCLTPRFLGFDSTNRQTGIVDC